MGRPPIGKVAMTGLERLHKHRAKFRANKPETKRNETQARVHDWTVGLLEAHIVELQAELSRERTRSKMFEAGLQNLQRQQRAESKPKAERPPLPPDEERERIIKGLKTRVRNLTAELRHTHEWYGRLHDGKMSFETMSVIAKVLHPDRQPSETERAEACRQFTAWKADKDKARRQGR
jgi:predicted RNase H-like nuclease (RuvC/YqgF family)